MEIVPEEQTLLVEVRVAPHLIDRVKGELPVDIRFSSFAHTPQLVVQGKVVSVSGDLLTDPQNGAGYYLAPCGRDSQRLHATWKAPASARYACRGYFLDR
jgi:protease secretion system membrane fusion protein